MGLDLFSLLASLCEGAKEFLAKKSILHTARLFSLPQS